MLIVSLTIPTRETLSIFGTIKFLSIRFLSSNSDTYAWISFEVLNINSAVLRLEDFFNYLINSLEKLVIHLKGVMSSWVTEDYLSCIFIYWYSIIASFFTSVMSLNIRTLHCRLLKIKLCRVSFTILTFVLSLFEFYSVESDADKTLISVSLIDSLLELSDLSEL